jgi:tetratricopeptide (TPR) repeat protein
VSVPSAAEVEHADWPTLQGMCKSLGLNPKGRSGVVRMRVLEHVRRRGRPESWRAGRDHVAALLTRLGFPDLSADLWESAIRLDAPGPWVGLGQAQVAGGFLIEAAKSFDRAIQMGDASALLHRAEALGAGGDYDHAIATCDSYLASHPTDLRAFAMKADFLARSGFKEEAARTLLAAADSHPEFPFLHAVAGTAFLRAGRPEVALEAFGPILRTDGVPIEAALNHGAALLLLGRTREAVDIFQKTLENAPERGEALNNLGVAYLHMDEPKLAASNLAQAAKHVDSPRIRLNLEKVPKAPPRPKAKKPTARKKPSP